jgi:hypothetical protein
VGFQVQAAPDCIDAVGDYDSIQIGPASRSTSCERGSSWEDDNIVWGTFWEDDNIVWGTFWEDDNIVWGTGSAGSALEYGAWWEDDNIVWGTSHGEAF